jgi:hypothetical protein
MENAGSSTGGGEEASTSSGNSTSSSGAGVDDGSAERRAMALRGERACCDVDACTRPRTPAGAHAPSPPA